MNIIGLHQGQTMMIPAKDFNEYLLVAYRLKFIPADE